MGIFLRCVFLSFVFPVLLWAQQQVEQNHPVAVQNPSQVTVAPPSAVIKSAANNNQGLNNRGQDASYRFGEKDEVNYTLGPNDAIEITMMQHPELSGTYTLDSEGKIQYEFVGDVELKGMTKRAAQDKIKKVVSIYVKNPRPIVKIVEYNSKAVYVIGQVMKPGKYYMRSETIPVREAIIEAGLPLPGSAMYRARLIAPNKNNKKAKTLIVDLKALLQNGDLQYNYDMQSGDQLYVPTTQEEMDYAQSKNISVAALSKLNPSRGSTEEIQYTLGPEDEIKVTVQQHPEISGTYTVNLEGKIQMEMVGDIKVNGLTKKELEVKIARLIRGYVDSPVVNSTILQYRSKVYYVIGQVKKPGKYYMHSETIPVREAIIEAGLPLTGSAIHRARLITPYENDKEAKIQIVDLRALFQGDMKSNYDMHPGDQLYVPTTQEEMDYVQSKNESAAALSQFNSSKGSAEEVRYTLGPDDEIKVTVQQHPEISGTYTVNLEGKIQMEMVGDIKVSGLTKRELGEKIAKLISGYVDSPDVNVTIMDYRSKVYYVIGEVDKPGKYYMKSESITVREAVVEAGLPTLQAAMRKSRLITPAKEGKSITKNVDLFAVLYGGDLDKNIEMYPGDFLYVPSTVMTKIFRVVAPVTAPITNATGAQGSAIGAVAK
ncbi:MAG: polysaccharide export protein [Candidatus Omnitrophica bacterium]|nr:polysaccharide export protein [Candidatus Omnitrophota bacterium]